MRKTETPPIILRFALLAGLWLFASIGTNPLVHVQALTGLSPAPLERFTGLPTIFSGMTEATHRLARGDLAGSLEANFLALPLAGLVAGCILAWRRPRIRTRWDEIVFFAAVIVGSVALNLAR